MAKINYTVYIDESIRSLVKKIARKFGLKEHEVVADAVELFAKEKKWKKY